MDRRQRKTRQAIFNAFTALLSKKSFNKITVAEIIAEADVGRATFYSHFETKDYLLKEFCLELFCHLFDSEKPIDNSHRHIFSCEGSESVFIHLFRHLAENDNNILLLLSGENNELFLKYFSINLEKLIESHLSDFREKKPEEIPEDFWKQHINSTLINTIKWWVDNKTSQSPEEINRYFFSVV